MQEIQSYIGNYGKYQFYIFCVCSLPFFLSGCLILVSTFTVGLPNTRCHIPGYDDNPNNTFETPFENKEDAYLYTAPSVASNARVYCTYCDVGNLYNGSNCTSASTKKCSKFMYDTSEFQSSVVSLFNMVCDDVWMSELLHSMFMVGVLIGGAIFGNIGDKFGRRKAFLIGAIVQIICANLVPIATNYVAYCILQLLIGAGEVGTFLSSFIIVMELFGGFAKTVFGILVQTMFAVAYLYIGLVAYYIRDWKYLTWSTSLLTLLFIPLFWLFPESIRWLVVNDRPEEARKIIERAAKMNAVVIPKEVMEKELKIKETVIKSSFFDLFKNGRMAVVTLIIFFTWMVCSLTYYGLAWNTSSLPGDKYVNFVISGLVEIPSYIICIPLMEYVGRRWSMVGFLFIGGASCIISGFLHEKSVVLGFAFLGKFCISAAYAVIYNYTAEIFPTVVRNAATGYSSLMARIGSISAPQVALLANYVDTWLPVVIYGSFGVAASVLDLFLPETKGRQLTETLEEGIQFVKGGPGNCVSKTKEIKTSQGTISPPDLKV